MALSRSDGGSGRAGGPPRSSACGPRATMRFARPPKPIIFLSYRDRAPADGEIHVRTRVGSEALLVPDIQRVVRELNPTLPIYDARTLVEHVDKNLFLRRIPARMFVVLGPLLLVLAA